MLQLPSLYQGVHRKSHELAELVGDLQKFFVGLEFRIAVDENFGPKTKAVVQEYQRKNGILDDGIVGPTTWGCLLADGFRPQSYEAEREGFKDDPNYPPRPAGARSPNGLLLFGKGFEYTPKPLPSMPEYVVPDSQWVRLNISSVEIPQLIGVRGAPMDGKVLFNRKLVDQVSALFTVWENLGTADLVETWGGSWVTRFIRGRRDRLSNHSFGSAFDINVPWNGYRRQPALWGRRGSVRELVRPAYKLGFFWGGWYNDGMHFEAYKAMDAVQLGDAMQEVMEEA